MRATTTIRAATAVGLVALLLLAVAALPATAQSESSFSLSDQSGGGTAASTTLSGEDPAGGTTASGATVELPASTTGGQTIIQPTQDMPETSPASEYQYGSLADTGGLTPLTMKLGLVALAVGTVCVFWRMAPFRQSNNRGDDDAFFV